MANTVIITAITPAGGDSVIVVGTVNGVPSNANASRAVIGSFANALTAQQYLAMMLLKIARKG